MKIAIASDGNLVSGHFGHCQGFTIYDIKDGKISNKNFVENPGHKPGFLPVFLDEKDVDMVVSGGMGAGAVNIFNEKNIEVVTGASGDVDQLVEAYLAGDLESTGSICNNHEHSDDCGNH